MEKVTFVFLNEYSLKNFASATTSVLLKPNLDNLTVECNCCGDECSNGIIGRAQKEYGAAIVKEHLE